jgi:hypothetical protein
VSEGTQGVYTSAAVEELTDTDLDRCIVIFSHRSEAHGAGEWTPEDVRPLGFARTGPPHWSTPCSVRRTGGYR